MSQRCSTAKPTPADIYQAELQDLVQLPSFALPRCGSAHPPLAGGDPEGTRGGGDSAVPVPFPAAPQPRAGGFILEVKTKIFG